jgi:Silicon transporter
LFAVVNISFE